MWCDDHFPRQFLFLLASHFKILSIQVAHLHQSNSVYEMEIYRRSAGIAFHFIMLHYRKVLRKCWLDSYSGRSPDFAENYIPVCYITEFEGSRGLWPYGNWELSAYIYDWKFRRKYVKHCLQTSLWYLYTAIFLDRIM